MKLSQLDNNGTRKNLKEVQKKVNKNSWSITDETSGPSKKMIKLSPWIELDEIKPESQQAGLSTNLLQNSFIKSFSQQFNSKKKWGLLKTFKVKDVDLLNNPFQVTTVDNFINSDSLIPNLIREMESIEWERKQMDLYEFYQTTDLANIQSQYLAQFYNLLNTEVKSWMEQMTGMKFQKISASCSMYTCGDHLLTHDDLLSNRLIAFVFYLSPWESKKHWNESMGGALELFQTDHDGQPMFPVAKKIFPADNRFVFFKVEKKSYHQVGEVLSKDYPRLTINGWFHGFENNADFDADAVKFKASTVPIFIQPTEVSVKLNELISDTYLKDSIKFSIQKQIEENSEAALGEFLVNAFHAQVFQELQNKNLDWNTKGPSNQRNYETLNVKTLRANSSIKSLLDVMTSKVMFKLLHEYTELDLHGSNAKKPKCTFEIQRWKGGCYSLIGDPLSYNNDTLDLVLYFGSNDNVGVITYLTPEGGTAEDSSVASSGEEVEPVLLTIYPQNNFLNIVYRSQGTANFTKYCSKSTVMQTEFNYILLCSYRE